jgi:hypothetical protein
MTYRITTRNRNSYRIHDDGAIERIDGQWKPDASRWRLIGILPINAYHPERMIPLRDIDTITDWTYKNGKPRFTGIDVDHGTTRAWGDGIVSVVKESRAVDATG